MCRLIETIKVLKGQFQNIHFHNVRLNKARKELWNCRTDIDIAKVVAIPDHLDTRLFKCRILYSKEIEQVEFLPYILPDIKSLKIIYENDIDYLYKYEDRSCINRLYASRYPCDDILIVKHGLLTDTSYCNIILSNDNKFYTPFLPLLKGTKRQQLIDEKKIVEKRITVHSIKDYQTIHLINAMIELEDNICFSTKEIY